MNKTFKMGTEFRDAYERNYRVVDIHVTHDHGVPVVKFIISRLNEGVPLGQITLEYDDIKYCEVIKL